MSYTPTQLPEDADHVQHHVHHHDREPEVEPLAYLWRLVSGIGAIFALGGGGMLVWIYLSHYLAGLRSGRPNEDLFFGLLISGLIVLAGMAQAVFAFKAKRSLSIRGILLSPACLYLDYLAWKGWEQIFS